MARPTILTPELQASIVADVRAGVSLETAAIANGVAESTLHDWRARGRTGEAPFREFSEAIAGARAQAKSDAIKAVRAGMTSAGTPDWKSEAWFLERTYPDEYGPQQAVNVKVEKELAGLLERLEAALAPDEYNKALRAIAGEASGEDSGGTEDE